MISVLPPYIHLPQAPKRCLQSFVGIVRCKISNIQTVARLPLLMMGDLERNVIFALMKPVFAAAPSDVHAAFYSNQVSFKRY